MPEARKPSPYSNVYISGVRLENIRLLINSFRTQAEFCRIVSKRESQVSQFFADPSSSSYRQVGGIVARDIEAALELPPNCLDREEGVVEFIPELTRRWKGDASERGFRSETGLAARPGELTSLQLATLDAVKDAMLAGKVTQADCLAMLNRWTTVDSEAEHGPGDRPRQSG